MTAALMGTGLLLALLGCNPTEDDRPNVVFVLADDMGYGDLGLYGHPYALTPNIDRLAADGTRLTHFYAAGSICIPSRAGFMTGMFPARFERFTGDFGLGEQQTVTAMFREAGYRTGHFGKWHIGPDMQPGTYGIETIVAQNSDGRGKNKGNRGRDAATFDQALEFIEANRNDRFYIQIWGHVPHFPANPDESFMAPFASTRVDDSDFSQFMREKLAQARSLGGNVDLGMRRYLGDVYSLDQDMGRLLGKLDELGLRENTLVVFTSDNGPASVSNPRLNQGPFEEYRSSMLGSPGNLRGEKASFYEGGTRVPFIVRWPDKIPAGRVDATSVVGAIDWLPTMCAFARSDCNLERIDGEDVSKAWLGESHERRRPLFWKESWTNSRIASRWGRWKIHQIPGPTETIELYDVVHDPEEHENLASAHPEVVNDLRDRIRVWNQTLPQKYSRLKN